MLIFLDLQTIGKIFLCDIIIHVEDNTSTPYKNHFFIIFIPNTKNKHPMGAYFLFSFVFSCYEHKLYTIFLDIHSIGNFSRFGTIVPTKHANNLFYI